MIDEPSDFVQDVLIHHGVKGQKWGVRRERDDAGSSRSGSKSSADPSSSKAKWVAAIPKKKVITQAEAKKNLAANNEKFIKKFDPENAQGDSKKGLSPEQKKLLIKVGVGAAIIGGIYLAGKYGNKEQLKTLSELGRAAQSGEKVPPTLFQKGVSISKVNSWFGQGFVKESSFARDEFTLPEGHTFHRISTAIEHGFGEGHATYATPNIDDFNRYIVGFRGEKGITTPLHHVTFSTTAPIKVPKLETVLDTLQETMHTIGGKYEGASDAQVLAKYNELSGSHWAGNPVGRSLLKSLKEKGYGAIVDEMDAGVIGESPLVVFADHLTSKVVKPITDAAIKEAEANLTEISNRKA